MFQSFVKVQWEETLILGGRNIFLMKQEKKGIVTLIFIQQCACLYFDFGDTIASHGLIGKATPFGSLVNNYFSFKLSMSWCAMTISNGNIHFFFVEIQNYEILGVVLYSNYSSSQVFEICCFNNCVCRPIPRPQLF